MKKETPFDKQHFKNEMDDFIAPHSIYTGVDRQRVLEKIERSKRRKKWWGGRPLLVLSVLLVFLISGTIAGVFMSTSKNSSVISAEEIMGKLELGMNEGEVVSILGNHFVPIEAANDSIDWNVDFYRLDFPAQKGYIYEESMDFLDIEGVVSGKMAMQVIVAYDAGQLVSYSMIYKDDGGKTVIRRVSDGDVETHVVD